MTAEFDPKMLRKIAAQYRHRAITETHISRTLLEIANEMDADALRLEH